ncbi:MAG: hypothetical protein IID32_00255 [Planctomycetes bacterium]|nr:hypothetical protein [Planctomycetota bacterium]
MAEKVKRKECGKVTKEFNRRELIGIGVAGIGAAVLSKEVMADQPKAMPTVKEISTVGRTDSGEIRFGRNGLIEWTNDSLKIGKIATDWMIEFQSANGKLTGEWTAVITSFIEKSFMGQTLHDALGTSGVLIIKDQYDSWNTKLKGAELVSFNVQNGIGGTNKGEFTFTGHVA